MGCLWVLITWSDIGCWLYHNEAGTNEAVKKVQHKNYCFQIRLQFFKVRVFLFFFSCFLHIFLTNAYSVFWDIDSISQAKLLQSHMLLLSCIWSQQKYLLVCPWHALDFLEGYFENQLLHLFLFLCRDVFKDIVCHIIIWPLR